MSGPSVVHKPDIWPLVYIYLSVLPVAFQPIRTDDSRVLVQPSTQNWPGTFISSAAES